MVLDPKQRFEPVPVTDCVVAYAIFANYDGEAPDSADMLLVSTKELAEAMLPIIAKRFDSTCYCEGFEHAKQWEHREVVARAGTVACTLDDAILAMGDEDYQGEGDEDEEDEDDDETPTHDLRSFSVVRRETDMTICEARVRSDDNDQTDRLRVEIRTKQEEFPGTWVSFPGGFARFTPADETSRVRDGVASVVVCHPNWAGLFEDEGRRIREGLVG